MLSIEHEGSRLCDGWTRREWLRIGGLGAFGVSLASRANAVRAASSTTVAGQPRRAKSCILLFFLGGPPQHETWDPKPECRPEIRGDLRPIATSIAGIHVGELMPRTARLMDKIAVLRAVHTGDSSHSSSGYYMTTGYPHQPRGVENARPGAPNDWPCLGAVVKRLRPGERALPPAITLPEQMANDGNLTWPGQDAGFLGRAADPWLLQGDPSAADFQIAGLGLPADVPSPRLQGRRTLLEDVNHRLDALQRSGVLTVHDCRTQEAIDLLASPQARRAFNLDQETTRVRDRYGRYRFGQSVLLARRLVEAGVPFIRVNWTRVPNTLNSGHWDTHGQNTNGLKQLMPLMDQSYSALLEDLSERGLLDDTLVLWMGEFGRTPRINSGGGRDHWGQVFSVALAGGGVRGGVVHGASDRIGGYPREGRVLPPDLTATVLHCLGIPPDSEIHDLQGRPFAVSRGDVVRQIL